MALITLNNKSEGDSKYRKKNEYKTKHKTKYFHSKRLSNTIKFVNKFEYHHQPPAITSITEEKKSFVLYKKYSLFQMLLVAFAVALL